MKTSSLLWGVMVCTLCIKGVQMAMRSSLAVVRLILPHTIPTRLLNSLMTFPSTAASISSPPADPYIFSNSFLKSLWKCNVWKLKQFIWNNHGRYILCNRDFIVNSQLQIWLTTSRKHCTSSLTLDRSAKHTLQQGFVYLIILIWD